MTTQRTPEFGLVMEASPGYTARLAGAIEAMGFDYLLCPDTQNLAPDPYGQLSLAAAATTRAWYEELRRSDTPVPRKRQLFDEMTREWNKVSIPQGILEPGALHPHEEIRDRPRP